jgi:hypothetical protein
MQRTNQNKNTNKMKLIINSKRYDTATAKEIAAWDNGAQYNDFHWCSETLYKTRNGAYFLHAKGGPFSEYAEVVPGARRGTSSLKSLTPEEAVGWLEKRRLPEILEREFPERIQDA